MSCSNEQNCCKRPSACASLERLLRELVCLPFRLWKLVFSPFLGDRCRFYPSCSAYACEAVLQRGIVYGLYLSGRRILRCHPFAEGGYDPVPAAEPEISGDPEVEERIANAIKQ